MSRHLVMAVAVLLAAGCGASVAGEAPDAAAEASSDASVGMACAPGRSVTCAGPGGCSGSQACDVDGTRFGPCACATSGDASTMACVPGQSIACAGAGGCISSQVCNAAGSAYGACPCSSDAALACIPGQSIACVGPYGCVSYQVCDASGNGYDPCVCADGGGYYGDGGLPDGYAPLPPPVGDQGYNAIWAYMSNWSAPGILLPLFSAPACAVNPPFGEYFFVIFEPTATSPGGTFPSCPGLGVGGSAPCYSPALGNSANGQTFEGGSGLTYTVSAFDSNGIATGQMDTTLGIVPLVIKNCL